MDKNKKLSIKQKQLLIALLIGDGTISSNYVFKLSHSTKQLEYLKWKIKQLELIGLKTNGLKKYISKCGYNLGKEVLYTQLPINPTIKALRRSVYKPKKTFTKNLLKWLTPLGIAIWYMDDGMINVNTSKQRSSIQHTIKLATCEDKKTANIIIEYFKESWNIEFRVFKERNKYYSLATRTEEDCTKFITIIKPYILEVPSLLYKIRKDLTKDEFIERQKNDLEVRDLLF